MFVTKYEDKAKKPSFRGQEVEVKKRVMMQMKCPRCQCDTDVPRIINQAGKEVPRKSIECFKCGLIISQDGDMWTVTSE